MPKLGEHVRRTREERGLQGKELAQLVNITPGYLSQIETGKSEPTLKVLRRIASALGVTPGTLLDGEPTETAYNLMLSTLPPSKQQEVKSFLYWVVTRASIEQSAASDFSTAQIEYLFQSGLDDQIM